MNLIHFHLTTEANWYNECDSLWRRRLEGERYSMGGGLGMSASRVSGDNRTSMFALDEGHQGILDQADRFAHKELYPLCERMDREEWWPEEAFAKIGDNG